MGRPKGSKDKQPRTSRVKGATPDFEPTKRETAIMTAVLLYKGLSTEQIIRRFYSPSTASHGRAQLARLYRGEYLHRTGGRLSHCVYFIDSKGIKHLAEHEDLPAEVLKIHPKNRAIYSPHKALSNDIRIEVELSCQQNGIELVEWRDEPELRAAHIPHKITVALADGTKQSASIIPDDYFVLQAAGRPFSHFIEIDRDTESGRAVSAAKRKKDWEWKILAYQQFFAFRPGGKESIYEELYRTGNKGRVLTITTSEQRLGNFKHITEAAGGRERFWFTTFDRVANGDILTAQIWNVAGFPDEERTTLIWS